MKLEAGNLKAAWNEDRGGWKTFIGLWVVILFFVMVHNADAWTTQAEIDGSTTNGNLVVFGAKGKIKDTGFPAAAVATTTSVAQVAANLATETQRAIDADATKLPTNAVVQTLSGDEPDKVPGVAAVNEGLDSKVDTTSGTATNLTVAGELLFPASAYGTNYILGLYFDATNMTLRSTMMNE
jgi:hypothetical protein